MVKPISAIFDWDGTVFPGFTLLPWTDYLATRDLFPRQSVEQLSALFDKYYSDQIGHDDLSIETSRNYAKGLAGISVYEVQEAAKAFALTNRQKIYGYVPQLLDFLHANLVHVFVVSGAPVEVLKGFAEIFPIDRVLGLEISVDGEQHYISEVKLNLALAENKARVIQAIQQESEIMLSFGNSLGDLPLFEAAEQGVVLNNSVNAFPETVRKKLIAPPIEDVYESVHSYWMHRRK